MNTVKLVGTIGNDPKVAYNNNGTCMTMLSVAENKIINGEKTVKWHSVRAVGELAEKLGNSVGKGSNISIKGVYDNYRDDNGKTVSYVRATSYELLEKGKIKSENEVNISGVIGKNPLIRENQKGTKMAWISIAENREVNGKQVTKWHNISAAGKIAESIEKNLKTGQLVQFKGVYDNYQEKDTNKTISFIRALEYKTIEKKKEQEQIHKGNESVPDKPKASATKKGQINEEKPKAKATSKTRKGKGNEFEEVLNKESENER